MVKEKTLTVSLEEFGLSQYEARAYVALISKGTISASELAYYSELPRTKVYPTLLKLEQKKLAIISKSKPIMCTAITPDDAFDDIVQEQIDKVNAMNTLVSKLKQVSDDSRKAQGSEEKRYHHINANNVLKQLQTMIEGSKSLIQMTTEQWGLNLLTECKEQILSVLRRNIDVKIIIPSSQIGSDAFKKIPEGVKIRVADIVQNCFIFDQTELLLVNNEDGKAAVFSSTDVLGANQSKTFTHTWKTGQKVESLFDLTKTEAQEICRIIHLINENGLGYTLNSTLLSKSHEVDLLKMLEKNGINLKTRSMDEIIEIIDSTLQITCSGHVNYDKNRNNITVESKMNGGHSLPWTALLSGYLEKNGYDAKLIYQSQPHKGEKIHIKISK